MEHEHPHAGRYVELPEHVRSYLESWSAEDVAAFDEWRRTPKHVRDFLRHLRAEETKIAEDTVRLMVARRAVKAWGVNKLTVGSAVFLGALAMLQGWEWLRSWWSGGE